MSNFIVFNDEKVDIKTINQFTPHTSFQESCVAFIEDWTTGKEAFLQHTSGSTGMPKLIEITRPQMMASAMMTIKALDLSPYKNSFLCLSPDYIAGKMMIVRSLMNTMNIVAAEPAVSPIIKSNYQIHFAAFTPMQMLEILSNEESKMSISQFDKVILGGGEVSSQLRKKLLMLACDFYSTYGMTETVSHVALQKLNGPDSSNYFTTLNGIEINIDQRECLTINGAVSNFNTIITNDRVNLINDHQFEWLGRVDNVINSGGIKIQSEKVEKAIATIMATFNFSNRYFVSGLPDEKLGERLVLLIEGQLDATNKKIILNNLKTSLSKYYVPKEIINIDQFKKTPTGKIQRKETLKMII